MNLNLPPPVGSTMRLPLRTVVFWAHLVCGVTVAGVVLMMSATGVVLTYEKQMARWADREYWTAAEEAVPADPATVLRAARNLRPETPVTSLQLFPEPGAPAIASYGRSGRLYLDPASGELRGEPNPGMAGFLSAVRGWHRWFNVSGDGRSTARAITGWSNFGFLLLVFSGLYLWFPRRWSWQHFKAVLFVKRGTRGKARDFNWHHVVGFWTAVPLAIVVFTGAMISFPKARTAILDVVVREEAGAQVAARNATGSEAEAADPPSLGPVDPSVVRGVVARASERVEDWRRISVVIPEDANAPVEARIEQGLPGQPQKRFVARYDAVSGSEVAFVRPEDQPATSRIRGFFRFAHTGEYFGLLGQTVAGIVTLLTVILVWTGLALSWRRMLRAVRRRWAEEEATEVAEAERPEERKGKAVAA
jgi:uncharacterized iron-regulated membrane protein